MTMELNQPQEQQEKKTQKNEAAVDWGKRAQEDANRVREEIQRIEGLMRTNELDSKFEIHELEGLEQEVEAALLEFKSEITSKETTSAKSEFIIELEKQLNNPETKPEALSSFGNKLGELLYEQQVCNFTELGNLLELVRDDAEMQETVHSYLDNEVGTLRTKRLLEDPNYRKELESLQQSLEGKVDSSETSADLCKDRRLDQVVAIHELFGTNAKEMILAINLSSKDGRLKMQDNPDVGALSISEKTLDPETGAIECKMQIAFNYEETNGRSNEVVRYFELKHQKQEDGSTGPIKTVEHSSFRLAPEFQGGGIATEQAKQSLKVYDKLGLDAIKLHAAHNLGGYQWASQGYGWDKQKTTSTWLERREKAKKPVTLDDEPISAWQLEEDPTLAERAFTEFVKDFAKERSQKLNEIVRESGLLEEPSTAAATQEILDKMNKILQSADSALLTPQLFAELGRSGPRVRKHAELGWHRAEAFPGGKEDEDPEAKGTMHLGKAMMLNTDWFGTIELKADGAQKGENRKLLEQKLNRPSKKGA